jgi:hypothetical protein
LHSLLLLTLCTNAGDQIEWPDRYVGWLADDWYDYENEQESVDFETQLMALQVCAGVSNHFYLYGESMHHCLVTQPVSALTLSFR